MRRLFTEQEANARAFRALTRFLELLDGWPPGSERSARAALDPLALSFQLKLLWLSGYLPHVTSCAECGADTGLAGYSPQAGGAVCEACAHGGGPPLSRRGPLAGPGRLPPPPLPTARPAPRPLGARA